VKNVFLALLLGVAWSATASDGSGPDTEVPDLPEILATQFDVVTLSGDSVSLSSLIESGRPVVVEFWATWCAPCRKTLPHLIELKEKHAESVVILGLTVEDPHEDLEKVRDFVADQHVNFQIAFAPEELFQFMNDRPDIAVPKLFVFDGAGRLVKYIPRYSPLTQGKVRAAVKKALSHE